MKSGKATAGIVRIVLKFIAFLVILIIAARFFYLGETAYTHSEFGECQHIHAIRFTNCSYIFIHERKEITPHKGLRKFYVGSYFFAIFTAPIMKGGILYAKNE